MAPRIAPVPSWHLLNGAAFHKRAWIWKGKANSQRGTKRRGNSENLNWSPFFLLFPKRAVLWTMRNDLSRACGPTARGMVWCDRTKLSFVLCKMIYIFKIEGFLIIFQTQRMLKLK
jgi:hypothetical protein